jgi:hypothetical protein
VFFADTRHGPEVFSLMPARHKFTKNETTEGGKFVKGEILGRLPLNKEGYLYTVSPDPKDIVEWKPGRFYSRAPVKVTEVEKVRLKDVLAKGWEVKIKEKRAMSKQASVKKLKRVLTEYINHSALNLGQAARDVRYIHDYPRKKGLANVKARLKSLANNLKYTALPPRTHHTVEELKEIAGKLEAAKQFKRGYNPWKYK